MTEIFGLLFFTEITSYFLEESDRNFGEVLIKEGVLIFNSPVTFFRRNSLVTNFEFIFEPFGNVIC